MTDPTERLPERKLWIAVLVTAIKDYSIRHKSTNHYWNSWLSSRDFEDVCMMADFNPEAVRRGFKKADNLRATETEA